MTPIDLLVPTYLQMLEALSNWLDKAQRQLPPGEAEALLSARLAPDMFPLSTQIRFSCVQALEGVCRLKGKDFPDLVETLLGEGRNAGDAPGSIAEARARIGETLELVRSLSDGGDALAEDETIGHALPNGMVFDLSVGHYARDWAMAQFYFHLMAAYAILRSRGVDLGKADYVAHMFAYLRPGTMPTG